MSKARKIYEPYFYLCISILEFKFASLEKLYKGMANLCISILEFKL